MPTKGTRALSAEVRDYFAEQGRIGGKKGAKARMEKVSPKRRAEIAREAAKARWAKGTWAKGLLNKVRAVSG